MFINTCIVHVYEAFYFCIKVTSKCKLMSVLSVALLYMFGRKREFIFFKRKMRKNISQITTQKILVLREDPPNQTVINEDINL